MALIQSTAIPSGSTYEIDQSLKYEGNDAYLSKTPASSGNRKTSTFSTWVKLNPAATSGGQDVLFEAYEDNANRWSIFMGDNSANYISVFGETGDSTDVSLYTDTASGQAFRDYSAWYHIMFVLDTTQSTASERAKIFVNGVQPTYAGTTYPSQNSDLILNKNVKHHLGAGSWSGSVGDYYFHGYMAETYFIDGQALTPADFAETGEYGEWKPIEYEGTFGTNGFYLPFKQDYEVEGFNTVRYKGNSTTGTYIGGMGFEPDLLWFNRESGADNRTFFNSITGSSARLLTNASDAEATDTNIIKSFAPDGFTLGSGGYANYSAADYTAFGWDMGSPKIKVVTSSGVQTDTGDKKFGVSSGRWINGQSDRLTVPTHDDWNLMNKTNYTIDFWVKHRTTINSDEVYVSQTEGSYANSWYFRAVSGGEVNFTAWDNGTTIASVRTGAGVVTTDNWHHVALVKSGNTYKIFVDGTDETDSGGSNSNSWSSTTAELRIGDNGSNQWLDAFVDEIRLSDVARYSSNFTPATSAYTRDANTLLLLHMDGANNGSEFLDHSAMDVNTNGSVTANVKANSTYGQSIVSYTGNNTPQSTVGHGLSSAPEMIIVKNRDDNDGHFDDWFVFHKDLSGGGNNRALMLNESSAQNASTTYWNGQTSTTFGVGGSLSNSNTNFTNADGDRYTAICFHSVTGYSKFGGYSGNGSSTGTSVTTGFKPAWVMIKRFDTSGDWYIFDNTRSPNNEIHEFFKANENILSSTERTSGYEIGIDFNSNGFQLKGPSGGINGSGGSYIYAAFADKREYAYWLDQSGNNNDWTSQNLTETNISLDSPTNNFPTLNPIVRRRSVTTYPTFTQGNLHMQSPNAGGNATYGVSTMSVASGKWYFEYLCIDVNSNHMVGIATQLQWNGDGGLNSFLAYKNNGQIKKYVAVQSTKDTYTNGDIIGFAFDIDNEVIQFFKNGVLQDTISGSWVSYEPNYNVLLQLNTDDRGMVNFGQDSSFGGNKVAQSKQDSGGVGNFYYEPPSGYLAMCTSNMSAPAVKPAEHFNTLLYTGNGSTQSITGVGFQPDFIWIKERNGTSNHCLVDAVRGVTKKLASDTGDTEETDTNSITAFGADGFSVGAQNQVNENNMPIVAWNWKANGSGSSNTDGSVTTTVSANVDAGFSIIKYTGSGSGSITIGHGLSKPPEFWVTKPRTDVSDNQWFACHKDFATDYYTDFNHWDNNSAKQDSVPRWGDTAPTSSVITVGTASTNNSGDYICYAWHSVEGYSLVGSWVGNGNADGQFVYTGFRPAYVLCKDLNNSQGWQIFDSVRSPSNVMDERLLVDLANAEQTNVSAYDFVSNGFKLRTTDGSFNSSGNKYIFYAVAEIPFKYSNAR